MKITKSQLKRIIQEEIGKVLKEGHFIDRRREELTQAADITAARKKLGRLSVHGRQEDPKPTFKTPTDPNEKVYFSPGPEGMEKYKENLLKNHGQETLNAFEEWLAHPQVHLK